jgi:hypothetical protein
MQELIRQNRDLSKKCQFIADAMTHLMKVEKIPEQRKDSITPSEKLSQSQINNTGNLNQSSNIYYNRIQNLTINGAKNS